MNRRAALTHLLVALATAASFPAAAGEPPLACDGFNDAGSGRDASPISPVPVEPGLYDGCIAYLEVERPDQYRIAAGEGEKIAVTFTWHDCESVQVSMFRLHPDGTVEEWGTFTATRGCLQWTLTSLNEPRAWVYLVEIRLLATPQGNPYTVKVERGLSMAVTCLPADDFGSGRDGRSNAPIPIGHGERGRGCTDDVDDEDYYLLHLDRPGQVHVDVEVEGECNYFDVYFLNADHGEDYENLTHLAVGSSVDCHDLAAIFEAREAGPFLLRISSVKWYAPKHIEYTLTVHLHEFTTLCGTQDDHGSGRDSTPAQPIPAAIGVPIHGCVDEGDGRDDYRLGVPPGAYAVTVSAEGCRQPFVGVDRNGDGVAGYHVKFDCHTGSEHYTVVEPETWTVQVMPDWRSKDWMGAYTVVVRRCEYAPPGLPAWASCPVSNEITKAQSLLATGLEGTGACPREVTGFALETACRGLR